MDKTKAVWFLGQSLTAYMGDEEISPLVTNYPGSNQVEKSSPICLRDRSAFPACYACHACHERSTCPKWSVGVVEQSMENLPLAVCSPLSAVYCWGLLRRLRRLAMTQG